MKRRIAAALAAAWALCAAGCVSNAQRTVEGESLNIYYATQKGAPGGDILAMASVPWGEQAALPAQTQAQAAMELLLGQCREEGFASPLPRDTRLLSCTVAGSVAMVDLSVEYGILDGIRRTVADYCIVLTLTQIQPIRMVRILVDGEESLQPNHSSTLLAGDALLTSTDDVVRTFAATLYFRGKDGELAGEERLLTLYEGESRGTVILNALLAKPESKELETLLPQGFSALSFRTEEGVCFMNLPSADDPLLPEEPEGQMLLIESIVKSLCSLDDVEAVQILLDGEISSEFGSVDISQPLSFEEDGED